MVRTFTTSKDGETMQQHVESIDDLFEARHEKIQRKIELHGECIRICEEARTKQDVVVELYNAGIIPPPLREIADKQSQIDALEAEIETLTERIMHWTPPYQRPNGRVSRLFNRVLAPHPVMPVYEYEKSHDVPKYFFGPLLTVIAVIAAVIAISVFIPELVVSPMSLFFSGIDLLIPGDSTSSETTTEGSSAVDWFFFALYGLVLVLAGLAIRFRQGFVKFINAAALHEEQWFRAGAENWTTRQRVFSSVSFGFLHIVNLIYPLSVLIVLCAAGGVFMAVYLRQYRRTGSTEAATRAAGKFHAMYNLFALGFMVLIALIYLPSFLLM